MTAFLIIAALAWVGWRAANKRRNRKQTGSHHTLLAPFFRPRAEAQGDAGETTVMVELQRLLTHLCGTNFYLHPGALLITHAPGTPFPTAEIDHLFITPFGMFIVETKNWTGLVAPGPNAAVLTRTGADGVSETRKSPDAQNRTKLNYLRGLMPGTWPVHAVGVFASDHCTLSPELPLTLMHVSELHHWMRTRKAAFDASGAIPVNVSLAREVVLGNTDSSPKAVAMHRERAKNASRITTFNGDNGQ